MSESLSLPPELWLYIHRLAIPRTLLNAARSEDLAYVPSRDPFEKIDVQDAKSFAVVSRLWNGLAHELLYENIPVPDDSGRFDRLRTALEHPANARLVRSIRLTTFRADHNAVVLALCTQVEVICHPGNNSGSNLIRPSRTISSLPTFQSLKHVFWTESVMTSPPLRLILEAAPNVEHLVLQTPLHFELRQEDRWTLPPLPRLRRLSCLVFTNHPVFRLDLQNLTRLACSPLHLRRPDFPTLPSLQTLELYGSFLGIDFSDRLARFPALRELCYDVCNDAVPPSSEEPTHEALEQLRLYSSAQVVRHWGFIEEHFALVLLPDFPLVKRLVLEGTWDSVVLDERFRGFRDGLRKRGSRVEYPEGVVRS
ncbi:hypothetical protein FB45DRAFT_907264 [Roridomyces roridus]|uniref:Uncharacterized protein n=1 Tax=Roridomyces roridus TaxID=1738132 RepID=A0AAD7C286_9AGAR|nr:hypothetical protein FB45DRAFT_907264 [Roridomyces roridus]